jgi:ribonuclease BN (tRNA processing enzyme)
MNARLVLLVILVLVMTVSWVSTCVIFRAAELGELLAPIDPVDSGAFRVTVVGSGSGYENPERMGPCLAIGWNEHIVLLDVGRGVAEALRTARIPLAQPDTILLSSLMPENTVGLDDLLLTGWRQPREKPLRVIGPKGTAELTAGILAGHHQGIVAEAEGMGLPIAGARIETLEVSDGFSEERDGMTITAGALPGGPTPALIWRFERNGRTVVAATTGWAQDAVAKFAKRADLLLHEAVVVPVAEGATEAGILTDPELLKKEAALHTSLLDVGDVAARAEVRKLALIRMRPPPFYDFQVTGYISESYSGEIVVPNDGDELTP